MKYYSSRRKTLLICIGNEYRQDDGVGLFIAKHPKIRDLRGVSIIAGSGDGLALIEAWKTKGTVILVDAVHSGRPAGTLYRFDALTTPLPADIFLASTHNLGIPECIALSRSLGLLPEKLTFYGIEGVKFGQGTRLSAAVRETAETAVEKISAELSGSNPCQSP